MSKRLILFTENLEFENKFHFASDANAQAKLNFKAVLLSLSPESQSCDFLGDFSLLQVNEFLKQDAVIRVTLVLPAQLFTWCKVKIPTKQKRQMQKALPFLIEDFIAVDPEECFIATGQFQDQDLSCAIVDREIIELLTEQLGILEWQCDQVLTFDNLLSASQSEFNKTAGLYVFQDNVILLTESGEFFNCHLDLLDIFLNKFKKPETLPSNDDVLSVDNKSNDAHQPIDGESFLNETLQVFIYRRENEIENNQLQEKLGLIFENYKKSNTFPYEVKFSHHDLSSILLELSKFLNKRKLPNSVVNILQGEFKPKSIKNTSSLDLSLNWKPVGLLLALFFLIGLLGLYIDTVKYQRAADKADLQAKEIFTEIFPGTRNFTSMQKRVAALLGDATATGDNQFLELLVLFSKAMKTLTTENANAIEIQRLQFEQSTGDLKVDVMAIDFDTLNQLKQLAEQQGINVEILSTSNEQTGVKGRLKVVHI